MSVIVVGLEQRHSSFTLLERVAVPDSDLPKALGRLRDKSNLSEAVILSTCLRTEIYAVVERFHDGVAEIEEFLATISGTPVESLTEHLTVRFDDDVISHLFSVAAGLDSAVIGESEVLGQVRRAWERAPERTGLRARCSGRSSATQSRPANGSGRRRRSPGASPRCRTARWPWPPTVGRVDWPVPGFSVVGAGEMGEGVTQALVAHDVASLVMANRTSDRTEGVVAGLPEGMGDRVSAPLRWTTSAGIWPPRMWSSPRWAPPIRSSTARWSNSR